MQLGVTGQSVLRSLAVVMVLGIVVRVSVLMGGVPATIHVLQQWKYPTPCSCSFY